MNILQVNKSNKNAETCSQTYVYFVHLILLFIGGLLLNLFFFVWTFQF